MSTLTDRHSLGPSVRTRIVAGSQAALQRRLGLALIIVGALALGTALNGPWAMAETSITEQAHADEGGFLPFAPAPAQPAGLCLVDTGVNTNNADTQGEILERIAIDGGTGNDLSPELHGTVLAMMAAAPANSWGMVGTAPTSIRIFSVRILSYGQSVFPFGYYTDGIATCLQHKREFNIRAINLSLGNQETPSSQGYEALANEIETANNDGIAVVAAAGNDDSGTLDYPAAYPTVLSVAATDTTDGGLCSFSNRGEGLRLTAPGCDLLGADPISGTEQYNYWQGSSEASVIAAAALTAMRAYKPELSPQTAENYLTNARNGTLDIAGAFRLAGLGDIVAQGETAEPLVTPVSSTTSTPVGTPQGMPSAIDINSSRLTSILPAPKATIEYRHIKLLLILHGRPSGIRVQVRLLGYRGDSRRMRVLRTFTTSQTTLQILMTGARELTIRYTDLYDITRASPWTTIKIHSAHTTKAAA